MTIIGTFEKTKDGYTGRIRTMTINTKATIIANDKNGNDKAPDFRIVAGKSQIGAAWRQETKDDNKKSFLSVELDDPSFRAPLRAAFFENENGDVGNLVWRRPAAAAVGESGSK